jgi:hypothetical protein
MPNAVSFDKLMGEPADVERAHRLAGRGRLALVLLTIRILKNYGFPLEPIRLKASPRTQ